MVPLPAEAAASAVVDRSEEALVALQPAEVSEEAALAAEEPRLVVVADERVVLEEAEQPAAALAARPPVEAAGEQQQVAVQRPAVADGPEVGKQAAAVDILEVGGKQADVEGT